MPNPRQYWLHTLSPTHVGIGRGIGYIDLPIDRDGVTGWPIIRASGVKGVLADHFGLKLIPNPGSENNKLKDRRKLETTEGKLLKAAFGIAGENNDSNSGALLPTDAKLVCLPVRSFKGTFAWATSKMCLQMLHRTLKLAGANPPDAIFKSLPDDTARIVDGSEICVDIRPQTSGYKVFLEDLDFHAQSCPTASDWADLIATTVFAEDTAWQDHFKKRFVVLPDSAFDFLCETGTEVNTRVRIDPEMKTVAKGALWTEESLPAESILMGIIHCDRVFGSTGEDITPERLLKDFTKSELTLQIGGKATVGRGQVRCVFREVN